MTSRAAPQADVLKLPDILTRAEAADFLRVKVQTLACWATQGRGPKMVR